jgi:beta-aspartyl-peptidase (threonine type)
LAAAGGRCMIERGSRRAEMIIAGTHNARAFLDTGWRILRDGGSALDAVEAVTREVEADLAEHSVGIGGYPNLAGEVELDASIMDGRTRACGAVAALRRYGHPVSVARRVMERLPHVLLVGAGAGDFAREMGFAEEELLTPEAAAAWRERLAAVVPEPEIPALLARERMAGHALLLEDASRAAGTVDVIAVDARADFASAVSTSGWAWKYPGRVGDSPIAGAGNYCDNRFGAAACVGHGELAIRASTARAIVLQMEAGRGLEEACAWALRDLPRSGRLANSMVTVLAVDHAERAWCASTSERARPAALIDGGGPREIAPAVVS